MKVVINTPTGHIGRAVVERLLDRGVDLVLLARDPSKVKEYADRGAEVRKGLLSDGEFLIEATKGAGAMLWVTPPDFGAENLREAQNAFGRAAAAAIRANRIPRVVNISSVGAQHGSGTGPVNGLHDVERLLGEAAPNIVHLRAAYFMENFEYAVPTIKQANGVFLPVDSRVKIPMVATRDIAAVAADLLADDRWTGRSVRAVLGPGELSFEEAAEKIGEAVAKDVHHVKVSEQQTREALSSMGVGDSFVENMLELYRGLENGAMEPAEKRDSKTTTPTTFDEFSKEVLAPMVKG